MPVMAITYYPRAIPPAVTAGAWGSVTYTVGGREGAAGQPFVGAAAEIELSIALAAGYPLRDPWTATLHVNDLGGSVRWRLGTELPGDLRSITLTVRADAAPAVVVATIAASTYLEPDVVAAPAA